MIDKPDRLSGRVREWRAVTRFAEDDEVGAHLGLVYGRRRQGKTFLLELLAEATGGFMFTALQQSGPQNLRLLGDAYAAFLGLRDPVRFTGWPAAMEALLLLGERRAEPTVVVLDEFPFLLDGDPSLPSLLQVGIGPTGAAFRRGRTRLILCGSALTTMRRLLVGSAPLRGRAVLELMLPPFGFREAAAFWNLESDLDTAFRVDALIGGTPAYRAMSGGSPAPGRFDEWIADGLLDPASAIFREGNVLLYEQPEVNDPALYFSVLGAIAQGAAKRSEIAALLERADSSLSHPLAVLEELQLVGKIEDALRPRRPVYEIREPVIRFHQLVIRPREAALAAHGGSRVWRETTDTVSSKIYGPHLEHLAREWTLAYASQQTLGGAANQVRPATVACREHRAGHEIDVVAQADLPHEPVRVLAIGEAKATERPVGHGELARLEHLRDLVAAAKPGTPKLLLFSRTGFTKELRAETGRADLELIDLERLYHGD
ncbi:AAA family ATPase [Hamadaea tsunoensis]|uniref:AAA family ATPase n=1 Tax=Hamadaea tsunoensis TaxID=53368 RepID=UPI00041A2BAC|nr:hypothetical protein [Hamadaea tsunoensis]